MLNMCVPPRIGREAGRSARGEGAVAGVTETLRWERWRECSCRDEPAMNPAALMTRQRAELLFVCDLKRQVGMVQIDI
jgi:hypothetical protein